MKPLRVGYKLLDTYRVTTYGKHVRDNSALFTKYNTKWKPFVPVFSASLASIYDPVNYPGVKDSYYDGKRNTIPTEFWDVLKRRNTYRAPDIIMCSPSAVHWYIHPLQAWLFATNHVEYKNPVLYQGIPLGSQKVDTDKAGSDGFVITKQIRRLDVSTKRAKLITKLLLVNVCVGITEYLIKNQLVYNGDTNAAVVCLRQLRRFRYQMLKHKTPNIMFRDAAISGYAAFELASISSGGITKLNSVSHTGPFVAAPNAQSTSAFCVTLLGKAINFGEYMKDYNFMGNARSNLETLFWNVNQVNLEYPARDIFVRAFRITGNQLAKGGIHVQ